MGDLVAENKGRELDCFEQINLTDDRSRRKTIQDTSGRITFVEQLLYKYNVNGLYEMGKGENCRYQVRRAYQYHESRHLRWRSFRRYFADARLCNIA